MIARRHGIAMALARQAQRRARRGRGAIRLMIAIGDECPDRTQRGIDAVFGPHSPVIGPRILQQSRRVPPPVGADRDRRIGGRVRHAQRYGIGHRVTVGVPARPAQGRIRAHRGRAGTRRRGKRRKRRRIHGHATRLAPCRDVAERVASPSPRRIHALRGPRMARARRVSARVGALPVGRIPIPPRPPVIKSIPVGFPGEGTPGSDDQRRDPGSPRGSRRGFRRLVGVDRHRARLAPWSLRKPRVARPNAHRIHARGGPRMARARRVSARVGAPPAGRIPVPPRPPVIHDVAFRVRARAPVKGAVARVQRRRALYLARRPGRLVVADVHGMRSPIRLGAPAVARLDPHRIGACRAPGMIERQRLSRGPQQRPPVAVAVSPVIPIGHAVPVAVDAHRFHGQAGIDIASRRSRHQGGARSLIGDRDMHAQGRTPRRQAVRFVPRPRPNEIGSRIAPGMIKTHRVPVRQGTVPDDPGRIAVIPVQAAIQPLRLAVADGHIVAVDRFRRPFRGTADDQRRTRRARGGHRELADRAQPQIRAVARRYPPVIRRPRFQFPAAPACRRPIRRHPPRRRIDPVQPHIVAHLPALVVDSGPGQLHIRGDARGMIRGRVQHQQRRGIRAIARGETPCRTGDGIVAVMGANPPPVARVDGQIARRVITVRLIGRHEQPAQGVRAEIDVVMHGVAVRVAPAPEQIHAQGIGHAIDREQTRRNRGRTIGPRRKTPERASGRGALAVARCDLPPVFRAVAQDPRRIIRGALAGNDKGRFARARAEIDIVGRGVAVRVAARPAQLGTDARTVAQMPGPRRRGQRRRLIGRRGESPRRARRRLRPVVALHPPVPGPPGRQRPRVQRPIWMIRRPFDDGRIDRVQQNSVAQAVPVRIVPPPAQIRLFAHIRGVIRRRRGAGRRRRRVAPDGCLQIARQGRLPPDPKRKRRRQGRAVGQSPVIPTRRELRLP